MKKALLAEPSSKMHLHRTAYSFYEYLPVTFPPFRQTPRFSTNRASRYNTSTSAEIQESKESDKFVLKKIFYI